jgi:glycosyltransferase involved in cell wall biosynthesis
VRILVDYRAALRERTGVGEYVDQATRALIDTAPPGESLVLFSASWKDRLSPAAVPRAHTADRRVPVRLLNLLWHRLEWPPVEWLAGAGIDVAQSMHPILLPTRRAARLVTVHDLDFLDHPERTRAEIRRDYPSLTPSHVQRADRVVVVSEHTAREVERRLHVARTRISVCPPGVPAWSRREAEPAEGGYVLFLGTLEPRKNVGLLLDAYERLLARRPDAPRLVLAGRVTPEAEPTVARARRPPLAGHVETLGYVQPNDRLPLFRGALAFVLPSHTEGFGMPAVEAMMAGVPVLAANRGALPQSVGSGGRLIDALDPDAWARALDELLGDAALRRRLSEDGRRHAEQFSWRSTALGLREAWALALEERARRHA